MMVLALYRYTYIQPLVDLIKRPMERDYDRELASLSEDSLINYAYFPLVLFFRFAEHLSFIILRIFLMINLARNLGIIGNQY